MARRSPGRPLRVAFVACVMAAAPCRAHDAACRDGACAPHCPVRPAHFGYHPTQWRRWPDEERVPARPADSATPAPPARSVVPGKDEESPSPRDAGEAARNGGERLGRLVEEADVARLADAASRGRFTDRLVAAMLSEHDPRARCTVLELAAGFDTPAAEAICAGALEDPDPGVRAAACAACARRRGAEAAGRLGRRAREDVDLGVRLRAIRALGELGDPAAIQPLAALLDDPDEVIRSRAVAALARATGRDLGPDVERWRQWAANPSAPPRWSLGAALRTLF